MWKVASPNFHFQLSLRFRGEVEFLLLKKGHHRPDIHSLREVYNEVLLVSIQANHSEPLEQEPDHCHQNKVFHRFGQWTVTVSPFSGKLFDGLLIGKRSKPFVGEKPLVRVADKVFRQKGGNRQIYLRFDRLGLRSVCLSCSLWPFRAAPGRVRNRWPRYAPTVRTPGWRRPREFEDR